MKYVALLSGGKDSCYNLVHCASNGHELVAAASLGPEAGKEELDSYLYQTVGQDAIEFVARALEVPLYRRVITGNAIEQGSEYGERTAKNASGVEGDETEDLFALLSTVKSHYPDLQGVSVGAILSNYQRVRVEHVCRRLGLTPLCYLWQRDQGELLAEMISSGLEAILIKVAGIGLTPKHLGKTLAEMEPTLIKLNNLYGSHICGEGGEYESLTLDCPLFKHRIVLTEVETVVHSDNDFATVAFLRIKNAVLEPKTPSNPTNLYIPPILEDRFITLRDAVKQLETGIVSTPITESTKSEEANLIAGMTNTKRVGSWVSVSNVERKLDDLETEISIEDEVTECFSILINCLAQYELDISNCININIFLSSMDLFTRVNAVYSTFFGSSPPARACVAVDLPRSIHIRLDCTAFIEKDPRDRQALHVQGLSYWAPANIGPYSQAITAGERIFISGQIGLIPSSLTLPSPAFLASETALASQHVNRVAGVLKSSTSGRVGHTQVALYWLSSFDGLTSVKRALYASSDVSDTHSPTLFVVVKALPKQALIEKQVLLHTGLCTILDEDDGETSLQPREPKFEQNSAHFPANAAVNWEISYFDDTTSSCVIISVRGGENPLVSKTLKAGGILHSFSNYNLSIRLFYIPSRAKSFPSLCQVIFGQECPPTTLIPCRFISTKYADNWDYAICIIRA